MDNAITQADSTRSEQITARCNIFFNFIIRLALIYLFFDFLKTVAPNCTLDQLKGIAEIITAFKLDQVMGWGVGVAGISAWHVERSRRKSYKKERDTLKSEVKRLKARS